MSIITIVSPADQRAKDAGHIPSYLGIDSTRANYLYALICAAYYHRSKEVDGIDYVFAMTAVSKHVETAEEALYAGSTLSQVYYMVDSDLKYVDFLATMYLHDDTDRNLSIEEIAANFHPHVKDELQKKKEEHA